MPTLYGQGVFLGGGEGGGGCPTEPIDPSELYCLIETGGGLKVNENGKLVVDLAEIIDPTLSLSDKAADAKATGDKIGELKGDLYNLSPYNDTFDIKDRLEIITGAYVTGQNSDKTLKTASDSTMGYAFISVNDISSNEIYVNTYPNVGWRAFGVDENEKVTGKIISTSTDYYEQTDEYLKLKNLDVFLSKYPTTVKIGFNHRPYGNEKTFFCRVSNVEIKWSDTYKIKADIDNINNDIININNDIININNDIININNDIDNIKNKLISVVVPPYIPFVIGHQQNIYYDAFIRGAMNKLPRAFIRKFDYASGVTFVQRDNCIVYNPTVAKTASGRFYWSVNGEENSAAIPIKVVNPKTDGILRIMTIGDSKVDNPVLSQTLKELFDADGVNCELIGTLDTDKAPNEGRSAWSSLEYCTTSNYSGKTNAFFNPDTSKFDFSYYMQSNNFSGVDVVNINLGTNDVGRISNGTVTQAQIIEYYQEMIDSIHTYNTDIIVCVGLTEQTCKSVINTSNGILPNDLILEHCQALIDAFGEKTSQKIFLTPLYVSMDYYEDYNFSDVPLSCRDTEKTIRQPTDRVHQSTIGYQKNADMMYATINYALSL